MLDIRLIRERPDHVKQELAKVAFEPERIDALLAADQERRRAISEVESLKAARGAASKEIAKLPEAERGPRVAETRSMGERIAELERALTEKEAAFEALMFEVPNLPHPDVHVGPDDSANIVVREVGPERSFDFQPKPHWDLATALDIIDFERGVKVSGTRFNFLKGAAARLQRALISWMVDLHVEHHGYREIYPPAMVKRDALYGTGNLPKFGDTLYRDVEGEHWWIPTAEVPVTNLYREEVLDGELLPIRHVAYSPCFRREKMSAGRDVRGIKRVHQFDKVEMVKFVRPETSDAELLSLVDDAEDVCRRLGFRHRVVKMCTGDLAFAAAMKFDVEIWAPGCGEWLEVSSCSNFRDFQARRANIRHRPQKGAKPEFVHTLNGSGLALPRVMIGVLENYQRADGSIEIPEALRPYMGGTAEIRA